MSVISSLPLQPVLPCVRADADPATAFALLDEYGVLIIENALSQPDLARLRRELDPWFERAETGSGVFFGRATRRFSGLFAKAPATARPAIDPLVLGLMERTLMGDDPDAPRCDAIELNLTQAIGIGPGEPAQFIHRDESLWPFAHDFEVMANAMWCLDDFTEANGATCVVPGSHRWPRDREPLPHEVVAATARAGSVILWLGGLLHGGGANRTDKVRHGVVMSYRLGWLAGAEKLLLSTPPEVARALPERLQRLIGYQVHRPNLGWVEGRDPILWLQGEVRDLAAADDNLTAPQEEWLRLACAANSERSAA